MIYGYARVSTDGQSVDAQVRQLSKAGCKRVFREVASEAKTERAQLRRVEERAGTLKLSARSHLPAAIDAIIRAPVVTARTLAKRLAVSHQTALGLLRQLVEAGIIKEARGRGAWCAYVTT